MRIDHFAYQRATRAALSGLVLQFAIALTLLIFGLVGDDMPLWLVSLYVFQGVWVWISLAVVFHQHRLERLEALEQDELTQSRAAGGTVFDETPEEIFVQARRLGLMHKWLMPGVSVLLALILAGLSMYAWNELKAGEVFSTGWEGVAATAHLGWAVAICLGFSLVCFVFSRFVAGMAKQSAWQNLRGGAGYMVGTALLLFALAIGYVFRFIDNDRVLEVVAIAVPIFMAVQAAEVVLNLVLNFYRPRIPGETPRPAYDSKLLSLFAAPDSLVRSLNEAVNYQFGFDITSSWGYQLLLRSFAWLIGLGVLVILLLNCLVVVEPHQQAVRLRGGEIVNAQTQSGVMFKWPWPIETAEIYDVTRTHELHLTPKAVDRQAQPEGVVPVKLWTDAVETEGELEPFIVGSTERESGAAEVEELVEELGEDAANEEVIEAMADEAVDLDAVGADDPTGITRRFSLVDARFVLRYRLKDDEDALIKYLTFASEYTPRRDDLNTRSKALRSLALREVTRFLPTQQLEEIVGAGQADAARELRERIQAVYDRYETGVEVTAVRMPLMRPSSEGVVTQFLEVAVSRQARQQVVMEQRQAYTSSLVVNTGDVELAERILDELETLEAMRRNEPDMSDPSGEYIEQRVLVDSLFREATGQASEPLANADADAWQEVMEQRSRVAELRGEEKAYRASPEIYRQLRLMDIYKASLQDVRKIISAVDPSRIKIDMELTESAPTFSATEGMIDSEEEP